MKEREACEVKEKVRLHHLPIEKWQKTDSCLANAFTLISQLCVCGARVCFDGIPSTRLMDID